jgi:hypothetical protein
MRVQQHPLEKGGSMGFTTLIEDFVGVPDELYNLVVEEINRFKIAGAEYSWAEEVESKKMLRAGEKARSLRIAYRGLRMHVLGFQIGGGFSFSVRKVALHEPDESGYLWDLYVSTFEEAVKRAARRALSRHLAAKNAAVPEGLDPREVFF